MLLKRRYGSGAKQAGCGLNLEEAKVFGDKLDAPIYQPYIEGDEISADLYLTKKGECLGVVCRERNLVVQGESQITTTFQDHVGRNMLQNGKELASIRPCDVSIYS